MTLFTAKDHGHHAEQGLKAIRWPLRLTWAGIFMGRGLVVQLFLPLMANWAGGCWPCADCWVGSISVPMSRGVMGAVVRCGAHGGWGAWVLCTARTCGFPAG